MEAELLEMTTYQWAMFGLGVLGFLVTAGGVVGACVWAVAKIKTNVTETIAKERALTGDMVDAERENFQWSMKDQTEEFQRCLKEITERLPKSKKRKITRTVPWGSRYAVRSQN